MTQEQINEIVEEYRRCKRMRDEIQYADRQWKFHYQGRMEAIKFTLEVVGVYVKEVALLL